MIFGAPEKRLRLNQGLHVDHPHGHAFDHTFNRACFYLVVVTDRVNRTENIELTRLSYQIEILEPGQLLVIERDGEPFRSHPIPRIEVAEGCDDPGEIVRSEGAADIQVLRDDGRAMHRCGKPADNNELNLMLVESLEEVED